MGFPLDRGSVEDGTLTCHWHHARFDLASGCSFDLWADDVPTCPTEVRDGEVWVRPIFGHADPAFSLAPPPRQQSRPENNAGATRSLPRNVWRARVFERQIEFGSLPEGLAGRFVAG